MSSRVVQGVPVPAFLYGTAWKEERTADLTALALESGFRGVDTANQRRHYFEAAVGETTSRMVESGALTRSELFLQTKFTHVAGQDHRLPYDPAAEPAVQVAQSFESSLSHLQTTYVDSYVLHGPSARSGIPRGDWAVWRAMEALHQGGKARLLGVSNVSLEQLAIIQEDAVVKPAFVQNRCYAATGWDREVRAFCADHGILYQGFSLLTANARVLETALVRDIARRAGRSPAAVVFRFAHQIGMIPLTGTSSPAHMKEDLDVLSFELDPEEIRRIEAVAGDR